jgi:photosystem II stability/assembly factor-like uncharacterized protein
MALAKPANLNGVSFSDSLHGTVVGANSIILRTIDAGATWTTQTSSMQRDFYRVSFAKINTGYAVSLDRSFQTPLRV